MNNHTSSTSHYPYPIHCKSFPRPSDHSSRPFPIPINDNARPIAKPSVPTPYEILNFLSHLIAINGYSAAKEHSRQTEGRVHTRVRSWLSPAPTKSSKSSESSECTSQSQKSTSSGPVDNDSTSSDDTQSTTSKTSTLSTASRRTLRPRVTINYSKTLLKRLYRRPQIRTLNNISIPLPDSSDEETQNTDEHTKEDTHKDRNMNTASESWTVLKHCITTFKIKLIISRPLCHQSVKSLSLKLKCNYFLYTTVIIQLLQDLCYRTPIYLYNSNITISFYCYSGTIITLLLLKTL